MSDHTKSQSIESSQNATSIRSSTIVVNITCEIQGHIHGLSMSRKPLASEASNRKHFDFENILHSKSTTIRFFVSLGCRYIARNFLLRKFRRRRNTGVREWTKEREYKDPPLHNVMVLTDSGGFFQLFCRSVQ